MKYDSNNKPLVCMQTQSTCYKGTNKMTVKGILWHSTAANNPTLKRYVQPSDIKPEADSYTKSEWLKILGKNVYNNDWNHIDRKAGLNCWIGKLADDSITTIQTMPWDYRPWGCGSGNKGSCNDGWIQFEICEADLNDKEYFEKAYREACEITAYLCKMFSINPQGTVMHNGVKVPTILCHQDSYQLGLGGDHSDVYHWFSKHNKTMENVRQDVAAILKTAENATAAPGDQPAAVETYKVIAEINRYTTSADAIAQKNSKGTLAAGTYYIYNKYPDGVKGMYNISSDKTGMSAGSWINPKENVLKEDTSTSATVDKLYRVRKSKDDAESQKGAFSSIDKAKECCQSAGADYHVFDWNYEIVYSYTASVIVTLSDIAVTKLPAKTTYTVGESYNGSGLVVTATYSDKTTKVITDYAISGFSSAKAGITTMKVTFEGKTTAFNLTIKEKEVVVEPEKVTAVYDLDYPEKIKIVDKSINRTNIDCTKAIKKILSNNSSFDIEIAKTFFKLAPKYGIDPMMAIAQSILETGWFKYTGSAVTADQHNYCGLGVTSNGVKGAIFATIEDGVTAQLQHLFAYGCKEPLSKDEKILDPRFCLVTRGMATYWQQLAGRWAYPGYDTKTYSTPQKAMEANNTYGQKILVLFKSLIAVNVSDTEVEKYFPTTIEEPTKPEIEKPTTEELNPETDLNKPEVNDNEQLEEKATNLATLIFYCIKKLIKMFAELFSKGE